MQVDLASRLELPENVRQTFRLHLAYALLDGACGGILLNAPVVALREIGASNWQLPLRDGLAGLGMVAGLYLGSYMAPRRKMPFVFLPGVAAGLGSVAMAAALTAGSPFWFLLMFGVGAVFEIVTRPAIAAILRQNYPVAVRGRLTSAVRRWSSLSFLAAFMLAAWQLNQSGEAARAVAGAQILLAGLLGIMAFVCFRAIPGGDDVPAPRDDFRPELWRNIRDAAAVVIRDRRFRRHVIGCLAEGFFMMLYLPLAPALFSTTLGFNYVWCAALLHGIPTLIAFATTAALGRWFDRANPWVAWAAVRLAFAGDALLLAVSPLAAAAGPVWRAVLPISGRLLRGGVQGGWWVLWWQVGVTHFAPPGEDTARYTGVMVFLNGAVRMAAAGAGMALAALSLPPPAFFCIGGLGLMAFALYALWQAAVERRQCRPQTFAQFEAQFDSTK